MSRAPAAAGFAAAAAQARTGESPTPAADSAVVAAKSRATAAAAAARCCLAAALCACALAPAASADAPAVPTYDYAAILGLGAGTWVSTFADEFVGASLNTSLWNVRVNETHCSPCELELYVPSALEVGGDELVVTTARARLVGPGGQVFNFSCVGGGGGCGCGGACVCVCGGGD